MGIGGILLSAAQMAQAGAVDVMYNVDNRNLIKKGEYMQVWLIDLYPITLFALLLFGLKPVVPFSSINRDYLSVATGKNIRGILALTIVFHHLAQKAGEGHLFPIFGRVGYFAVAVFFFLSGYGLQRSYLRSSRYKDQFLLRRIPPVLLPYLVVTLLFWVFHAARGTFYSAADFLFSVVYGSPIVSFSWYINNILAFYLVFWILMNLCGSGRGMVIGACVWHVLYVAFCRRMDYGPWWYNASHLLIVGMIWACCEERILNWLRGKTLFSAAIVGGAFLLLAMVPNDLPLFTGREFLFLAFTMLRALLFVLGVLLFSMMFQIGNPILSFLGEISLEIYLVQGLLMMGLRGNLIWIQSGALYVLLVVLGSVALAAAIHKLLSVPLRSIRNRC